MSINVAILALGLYPSTGGPSKSIPAFHKALAARVISWVDPIQCERDQQVIRPDALVTGSRLPILRQLLCPSRGSTSAAEQIVSESDLVSVHSFWRYHCQWIHRVAKRHRVPYWFVPHGVLDPYVFQSGRAAKRMFMACGGQQFLDDAAGVVCSTHREYEKLRHLVPRAKRAVVHWPLHRDDFRERNALRRNQLRTRLGIPSEATSLLYLGRLHPMKRPLETIQAVADSGRTDVHLVIAGPDSGVTASECLQRAKATGIQNRVHVMGPVAGQDKHDAIDASDAYVSLSHRENFNYSAAECLASGIPVILSPGNDLAADLANVDCGWLLENSADAPFAISEAASVGPSALAAAGHRGHSWAEASLTFDAFQSRLASFAADVVNA